MQWTVALEGHTIPCEVKLEFTTFSVVEINSYSYQREEHNIKMPYKTVKSFLPWSLQQHFPLTPANNIYNQQ